MSYPSHCARTLHMAAQCLIAGTAGYTHGFVAWLFPFLAEEVGTEVRAPPRGAGARSRLC